MVGIAQRHPSMVLATPRPIKHPRCRTLPTLRGGRIETLPMHISDDTLERVRNDGFAVVEGFLDDDELASARADLFREFPTHEAYFDDPDRYRHLVRHQFAGLRVGPVGGWNLCRLAFHPDLVDAAERFCGTTDLSLYKIEVWAKYSGAIDYDQSPHRDYGNHTLVVPRRDGRWPQLTTFVFLSDVTEENGPTLVVPRSVSDTAPYVPREKGNGTFAGDEVSVTGPAGSLFLYTTDILHRGSRMTGHPRSRFALLADYCERGNPWVGKVAWPNHALHPVWTEIMERATVRERDLFGFPPPGHEYWNQQTLEDVQARYPRMDLTPYRTAV